MSPTRRDRSSKSSKVPKTLVIVPTYNEIENLQNMYDRIVKAHSGVDILIIDDRSPDGTATLADKLGKRDRRAHVLHQAGKLGLGAAALTGIKYTPDHQ